MPYLKVRRRKRSAAASASPWAWVERIPIDTAQYIAFAIMLVLGLAMIGLGGVRNVQPGAVVAVAGFIGTAWHTWKWSVRASEKRRRRAASLERSRMRSVRRERNAQEQAEREKRTATDTAAQSRAKEIEEARRQEEVRRAAAVQDTRRTREEALRAETTRILAMDDTALRSATIDALRARGYRVVPGEGDGACDLQLQADGSGQDSVARVVPRKRVSDVTDVEALDAWRADARASTGLLISVAGFTAAAVKSAAALPVILVEAHLLAQWASEPLQTK